MAETNLAFSKIVATPTPTAWSQAYSAGRLFAALSLQSETIPEKEEENLNSLGKDLISTLESEFFTLENKDLDSIKQALTTSLSRVREGVRASFVVCFLSDNVLYLFAGGGGKVVLKRGDKLGTVLQGEEDGTNVKSASGYVREGDTIILQTKPFQRIISSGILASSLDSDNPDEIAETIAPHVHDKSEGGASAVILIYKEGQLQDFTDVSPAASAPQEETQTQIPEEKIDKVSENGQALVKDLNEEEKISQEAPKTEEVPSSEKTEAEKDYPFLPSQYQRRKPSINLNFSFFRKFFGKLTRSRKIILTVAAVLVVLIALTSFLALRGKQSSEDKALFASIYEEAKSKYDEGQNLKDLNAPLARESFTQAKKILDEGKDKFKEGASEKNQILELLTKVNTEIASVSVGESTKAKEVDKGESKILSYEINNSSASYFTKNQDNVYFLDGSGVSKIDKKDDKKTQIIKKDWKEDGGIGLFGSNIYVLDRQDGILKFVSSGDNYSKNNYFSGDGPDLGSSVEMTIDGSVFILFKDGAIDKYTRGKKDTFLISDMDKGFSSPTKIFTDEDTDSLYILDNGNSRIVVLEKSGKFKAAYVVNILKNAKNFDVAEKDKKIFVLSSDKVYQIDLK